MMSSPRRGCFGASSVGEIRNGKVGNNKRNSRVSFCAFLKEKVPMIQSARVVLRLARFPAGTCRTFKSSIYLKKSCVYSFLRWTGKIRFKGRAQYQGSCEIRRQQYSYHWLRSFLTLPFLRRPPGPSTPPPLPIVRPPPSSLIGAVQRIPRILYDEVYIIGRKINNRGR